MQMDNDNDTVKNVAIIGLAVAIPVAFVGGITYQAWASNYIIREKVTKIATMLSDSVNKAIDGLQSATDADEYEAVGRQLESDIEFINITAKDTWQFIKPRKKPKK
jgi:hypothetical protein